MSGINDSGAARAARDAAKKGSNDAALSADVEVELTLSEEPVTPAPLQIDPKFLQPEAPAPETVKVDPKFLQPEAPEPNAVKVDPAFLKPEAASPSSPASDSESPFSPADHSPIENQRPGQSSSPSAERPDPFAKPENDRSDTPANSPFSKDSKDKDAAKSPLGDTRKPELDATGRPAADAANNAPRDWGKPAARPVAPSAAKDKPAGALDATKATVPGKDPLGDSAGSGALGAAKAAKDLVAKDPNAGAGGNAAKAAGALKGIQGALEGYNEGGLKAAALKGVAGARQGSAAANAQAAGAGAGSQPAQGGQQAQKDTQRGGDNSKSKGDGKLTGKNGVKLAGSAIKAGIITFLTSITGIPPEVWSRLLTKKMLIIWATAASLPPLMLFVIIFSVTAAFVPTPEPESDDQAMEYVANGWHEVLTDAALTTRREEVPVPWTVLGGIAKATTDFGRTSPYDKVDHDKPRKDEDTKESPDPEDPTSAALTTTTTTTEPSAQSLAPGANALAAGTYAAGSSCRARLPDPVIGGEANQAKGPFLLTSSGWKEMEGEGYDANNPCDTAEWVAAKLAEQASEYLEANPELDSPWEQNTDDEEGPAERDADAKFWAQVITDSGLIQDPTGGANGGDCTVPASTTGEAYPVTYLIEQIWNCEISSGPSPKLVTAIKTSGESATYSQGDSLRPGLTLIQEAYAVSYAYSKWDIKGCDNNAAVAGIFPLDKATASAYGAADRCDPQQNIRAAARAVLAVEREDPETRSSDLGLYQPMLGGWLNLSNVFGEQRTRMLTDGPSAAWQSSDACTMDTLNFIQEVGPKAAEFRQLIGASGIDVNAWEAKLRTLATKTTLDTLRASCTGASDADFWAELATVADLETSALETGSGPSLSVTDPSVGAGVLTPVDEKEGENYVGLAAFFTEKANQATAATPVAVYGKNAVVGGRLGDTSTRVEFPSVAGTNISQPLTSIAQRATDYAIFFGGTAEPFNSVGERVGSLALAATSTSGLNASDIPADLVPLFLQFGQRCPVVTPAVLAAQAKAESGFNPRAVSPVGAQGLSQFMPATWAAVAIDGNNDGKIDPFTPADAIASQAKYMCDLAAQYANNEYPGGQLNLTLAAYNAGSGNVRKYGGIPPFNETQNYIKKINDLIVQYSTPPSAGAGVPANVSGGGPGVWGGYSNGRIPDSEMRGLSWAPHLKLRCDAARAMEGLNAKYRAEHGGKNLDINGSYRSYEAQVSTKAAKGFLAAKPGTSNHGWGLAVDVSGMNGSNSSPQYKWWAANAGTYGWVNPAWAKTTKFEPWHWEFQGSYDAAANAACMAG